MPLNHGVTISYTSPVSGVATLGATEPIAVLGVAQTGSATPGTMYLVNSSSEAQALFGAHTAGDTLPRAIEILQRYGCTNLIAIEVVKGADDVATAASLVTALDTLLTAKATLGITPKIILVPGFSTVALIDKALLIAEQLKAIAIFNFLTTDTVTTVTTARNGSTGLGLKNARLVTCFPSLKNTVTPTVIEPLSVHVAGALAWQSAQKGSVASVDNVLLKGVSTSDITFTTSWSDETADSEKMFDLGVVTLNMRDGLPVIWGEHNAGYPVDVTGLNSITAMRVRDLVAERLYAIAQPWIGQPGEIGYALSLQAQMQQYLDSLTVSGNNPALRSGKALLDTASSNFSQFLGVINWVYQITLYPTQGVDLITLTVEIR